MQQLAELAVASKDLASARVRAISPRKTSLLSVSDRLRSPPRSESLAQRLHQIESEVVSQARRENEEECSGGETRTHNLAVNSRLLCH
jgi:hypothetical protein